MASNNPTLLSSSPKNKKGWKWLPTRYLVCSATLALMQAQAFGAIHTGMINFPQAHIVDFINASFTTHYDKTLSEPELETLWGWIVSLPSLFALFSISSMKFFAEKYGRKKCIFLFLPILNIFGSGLAGLSKFFGAFELFMIARALVGLGQGLSIGLASMYNAECSPPEFRGRIMALTGFTGCLALMLSYIITLPAIFGTAERWPLTCLLSIAYALIGLAANCFVSESPKYLYITKKNRVKTAEALRKLYGSGVNVEKVFHSFEEEALQTESHHHGTSLLGILRTRHLRTGLLLGCAAAAARSTCGINIFYSYSRQMLTQQFDLELNTVYLVSIGMILPQIIEAFITSIMLDHLGRRPMYLGALITMNCCYTLYFIFSLAYQYYAHINNLAYLALASIVLGGWVFPLGVTPVSFYLVSEVTPQIVRSKAATIAFMGMLGIQVIQMILFPLFQTEIGAWSTLILIVIPTALLTAYLYRCMPETKGKSVEQIVSQWIEPTKSDEIMLESEPIAPCA